MVSGIADRDLSHWSGFLISVMQYISAIEAPVRDLAAPAGDVPANSKIPLIFSSIIAIVGGVTELNWLMDCITAWIFFLLRWLQRLERNIVQLQSRYRSADQIHPEITQPDIPLPIAAQAVQINHNCWIRSSSGFSRKSGS